MQVPRDGSNGRHYGWDRDRAPIRHIDPGEVVTIATVDAFDGQLDDGAAVADVAALDLARANPLTGPFAVTGAQPGDGLIVEILDVSVGTVGWTTVLNGFGLLAHDFPEPALVTSHREGDVIAFGDIAQLDALPFCGTVGVAPAAPGEHSVIPPRNVGGNLDCRDVRVGARLWVPVEVEGALLSIGDAHMTQGDGEVCGTAVETTAEVQFRVHVASGAAPVTPRLDMAVPAARTTVRAANRHRMTLGVGPDLMEASRDATRAMIDLLMHEDNLAANDAYMLCSVAGHLRIIEVVDAPHWVVGLELSTRT